MRYHAPRPAQDACGSQAIAFLLEKVATLLVLPVGIVLLLGLAALLALACKRQRLCGALLGTALLWLWMCSTPLASALLIGPIIGQHPPKRLAELPNADAIVVLGSAVLPANELRPFPHIHTTADRAWHAARLFHAGKAPLVVASGGAVWPTRRRSAAESMRELLVALGVPNAAVVSEEDSRTTRENAVQTSRVAAEQGIADILLVTSPWHMPRAVAAFRAVGLRVTPAPSDYAQGPFHVRWAAFLPSAATLSRNTKAMRELLAQLVYRWRGWA